MHKRKAFRFVELYKQQNLHKKNQICVQFIMVNVDMLPHEFIMKGFRPYVVLKCESKYFLHISNQRYYMHGVHGVKHFPHLEHLW